MTNSNQSESRSVRLWSGITADFTTRAWVLIPIGISMNVVIGFIANALKLPIFLNVIGTILVGILAGPWVAAVNGLLAVPIEALVVSPAYLPFTPVDMAIGLTAGFLATHGWFRNYWKVAVSGLVITMVAVLIASPINVLVFGGVTGHGSGVIFAYFLATGSSLVESVLTTGFIVEPIDKVTSTFVAFLVASAVPMRYRPARGRQTLPG